MQSHHPHHHPHPHPHPHPHHHLCRGRSCQDCTQSGFCIYIMDELSSVTVGSGIILQKGFSQNSIVSQLAVVFFKPSQVSKLGQLIGSTVPLCQGLTPILNGEMFWLLKACEGQNQPDLQQIQRAVSLSDTVVCIDLSNFLQSFIQKTFCSIQRDPVTTLRLIFVNQLYREKKAINDISYFPDIESARMFIQGRPIMTTCSLRVADVLQIYDCQKVSNVHKVKSILQKYSQLKGREILTNRASDLIFKTNRSEAEIRNQLDSMALPQPFQDQLKWKQQQLRKCRVWIQGEHNQHDSKIGGLTFSQLDQPIQLPTVFKYHQQWSNNSLLKLKSIFNLMSSSSDKQLPKEFEREVGVMDENLQKIRHSLKGSAAQGLLDCKLSELRNFHNYHRQVVEDSSLGTFNYLKGELKFTWMYQNNVFKRLAAFLLLVILACFQEGYIGSLVCLILAAVTVTIRL